MPAFGPIGAYAGSEEAHAGFKVFAANEDRKGLAWMVILHQGSGSPRRGTVRFHSLETWLFRNHGRRLVAHTRTMADFGEAIPNCPRRETDAQHAPAPEPTMPVGLRGVGHEPRRRRRVRCRSRVSRSTMRSPSSTPPIRGERCSTRASPAAPTIRRGWDSYCKGDKRTVFHPRWTASNRGRSRFRTDALGRRSASGLLQVVSRRLRVDQSDECCGPENAFIMERPSDGGLYRAGRGLNSKNFEFPGYCVLRERTKPTCCAQT